MKPYYHAHSHQKRFGVSFDDALKIHNFIDSSGMAFSDIRHRALLHHSYGAILSEKRFQKEFSDPTIIQKIAYAHCQEDCAGKVPTPEDYLKHIPLKDWMKDPIIRDAEYHAQKSRKRYGGKTEDYLKYHTFLKETETLFDGPQHKALLHHSFGCYILESIFGNYFINSDHKIVPIRTVFESHIKEEFKGKLPNVYDWLISMKIEKWMHGTPHKEGEPARLGQMSV